MSTMRQYLAYFGRSRIPRGRIAWSEFMSQHDWGIVVMSGCNKCDYCGGPVDDTGACPACSGTGGNTCTNVNPPDSGGAGNTGETTPQERTQCCGKDWTWSNFSKRWWCTECGAYQTGGRQCE